VAPRVDFHTGVADDVGFACRLLRKAYRLGARVLVRAPAARLARLDRELWTCVEREFLPHLRFAAPGELPAAAARTPIWLVDGALPPAPPPVLLNLGAELPSSLDDFDRIIEVVSVDADEAQRGRQRWRAYAAQGLTPTHLPATAAAPAPGGRD
jgi:DNA polymerase-3 subunit chi